MLLNNTHMKYLIILIIASTCIGCAGSMSSYEGKGGPFYITRKSDHWGMGCYILSIRDTGIVIVQTTAKPLGAYNQSAVFFYHRDSIETIAHSGLEGMSAPGALAGGLLGFLTVFGISEATYVEPPHPTGFHFDFDYHAAGSVGLGLLGALTGTLIGGWVFSPQNYFDLNIPDDKEKLISLCKYCGHEPDFVNAIK